MEIDLQTLKCWAVYVQAEYRRVSEELKYIPQESIRFKANMDYVDKVYDDLIDIEAKIRQIENKPISAEDLPF